MKRVVGRISRAHGIRGELNVDIRTDEPERRFAAGSDVFVDDRQLTVRSARRHGDRMVVAFTEIRDRNDAEALQGVIVEIEVDRHDLPEGADEFYDHQLVGLAARTSDGVLLGHITEVIHLSAQDTIVVNDGSREVLVPFVAALVPEVNVASGFIVVADRPGLLKPEEAEVVEPHAD